MTLSSQSNDVFRDMHRENTVLLHIFTLMKWSVFRLFTDMMPLYTIKAEEKHSPTRKYIIGGLR